MEGGAWVTREGRRREPILRTLRANKKEIGWRLIGQMNAWLSKTEIRRKGRRTSGLLTRGELLNSNVSEAGLIGGVQPLSKALREPGHTVEKTFEQKGVERRGGEAVLSPKQNGAQPAWGADLETERRKDGIDGKGEDAQRKRSRTCGCVGSQGLGNPRGARRNESTIGSTLKDIRPADHTE